MWCCDKDNLKQNGKYKKSVFDKKQIDALKRKFNYVSGNQPFITRQTFKKNIGYLGIRAVTSFLDRIFNSFDIDGDNKISFEDFIQYMQILKDGTDDQKAQISFNLIYMELPKHQKRHRKSSAYKNNQNTFQLKSDKSITKIKEIDMTMFERFFQDFYKSWSSITNESIPKQTKTALKQFINELFRKVQTDGRKTIDLQYYKILYKDRQFMLAFRQINSKLGNFFIKSTNNEYQKNVTLFHKILKKIITLSQKVFPLLNKNFLQDQKHKNKSNQQTSSLYRKNQNQTSDLGDQNVDKYFYDAKRYQVQNIFEVNNSDHSHIQQQQNSNIRQQPRKNQRSDTKDTKTLMTQKIVKQLLVISKVKQIQTKQNLNGSKASNLQQSKAYLDGQKTKGSRLDSIKTVYQSKLQDHVAFLQHKLLYLQNAMKQIIDQTKQIYNQMHNEFIKIFQRIQKQQHQKQSQRRQFSQDNYKSNHQNTANDKQNLQIDKKTKNKSRKSDKKVFFGDKNFNLVLEIMVGIQMSVRSVSGFQQIIFQEPQDFNLKHTFEMDYGHFGQNDILYTFTDYAPNVFNHVRKIYGIGNQQYISSIGPNKMMSALIMGKMASFQELVSQGKSGSFFYHTQDGNYLIKTISQREFYLMRKILQQYFRHIKTNQQTLMPRIFGLHKITETLKKDFKRDNRMTYYLIVMNNFFNTKDKIVDRYDLKGSWIGRQNTSGRGVKKDENFLNDKRKIDIQLDQKIQLYQIIQKDVQFFSKNQIIDYSMLLGFVQGPEIKRKSRIVRTYSLLDINELNEESPQAKKADPHILQEKNSMNFKFCSQSKNNESYLLGIIDILTEYNSFKQAQHCFKGCIYDSKGISAVPSQQYKNRFLDFMKYDVFKIEQRRQVNGKEKNKKNEKNNFDKQKLKSKQKSLQKSKSKSKKKQRETYQESGQIYQKRKQQ